MIKIQSGARVLSITPYERENTPEAPPYDWIRTYIKFSLPELKTQYATSFTVGELMDLKHGLSSLYDSLIKGTSHAGVQFDSLENQININFLKVGLRGDNAIELTMRPEKNADSVIIKDFFGLDESYFPALISGLTEMINWQN